MLRLPQVKACCPNPAKDHRAKHYAQQSKIQVPRSSVVDRISLARNCVDVPDVILVNSRGAPRPDKSGDDRTGKVDEARPVCEWNVVFDDSVHGKMGCKLLITRRGGSEYGLQIEGPKGIKRVV